MSGMSDEEKDSLQREPMKTNMSQGKGKTKIHGLYAQKCSVD